MQGLLFSIISPFFSSLATIISAEALKHLSPLAVRSFGAIYASVILFFVIKFTKEKVDLKKIKYFTKNFVALILLRPLIGNLLLVYGLSLSDGIKAIFFTKTEPYFVLFWHWLLRKEKVSPYHGILLLIHILGAIILSTGGIFRLGKAQLGDVLIIISMMFLSLSYMQAEKLSKNVGPKATNLVAEITAGVILLPFVILLLPKNKIFGGELNFYWGYIAISVILFQVIGLTLWYSSLKSVKGWMVSALRSVGPVLGAPIAWLFFKQSLSPLQILGAVIVLLTSAMIAYEHFKQDKNKNK